MRSVYNTNTLVEVEIVGFKQDKDFTWHEAVPKKRFWQDDLPAGFSNVHTPWKRFSAKEMENGSLYDIHFRVHDNKVYYKPYVRLHFCNDKRTAMSNFETLEEAQAFAITPSRA